MGWRVVNADHAFKRSIELGAEPYEGPGKVIDVPAMFIGGASDWGMHQTPGALEKMEAVCTDYRGTHVVDGAGHWVQQEQYQAVIDLVLKM